MCRPVALFLPVFALAMASGTVSAVELRELRLVQSDAGTRAELRLDGAADARVFELQNPDRLVVDLPATRAASGFRLPGGNGAVVNLRTGQPVPGTLRIVFDLGMPVRNSRRVESVAGGQLLVLELAAANGAGVASTVMRTVARTEAAGSVAEPLRDAGSDAPSIPMQLASGDDSASPASALTLDALVDARVNALPPRPVSKSVPPPVAMMQAPVALAVAPMFVAQSPSPSQSQSQSQSQSRAAAPSSTRGASRTMLDVVGRGQRKLVVAIDAGHGGKDPGAHGPSGVREKMVTLAVARELARQVNSEPGMRAVLIRDEDEFVPLSTRYMKARAAQADLFISIHADASPNDSATGASVFVLSTRGASSQAARWLADSENAADLVGGVSLDSKDRNLAAVLLDLSQSATMRASDDVAEQVLGALKNVGKAHKQSIERANFVVLRSPDVPSMLVETGFITNAGEERRLNDPGYRTRLAAAITDGVRRYFIGQPPPGSWYASRSTIGGVADGGSAQIASAPD